MRPRRTVHLSLVREQLGCKPGRVEGRVQTRRLGHRRVPERLGFGELDTFAQTAGVEQHVNEPLQSLGVGVTGTALPELD
jgi:hypothetical protein